MNRSVFNSEPRRIAKYISLAGICSRRQAEVLIHNGKVKVDGQVITSPALNVDAHNVVEVNGQIIKATKKVRLWLYYKPVGLITTHNDPQNRPTVFEGLKASLPCRVVSVGRLDLNSEGLLLLTNSGDLASKLESPKSKLERVYRVRAHGNITRLMDNIANDKIRKLNIDGIFYKPKSIILISNSKTNSWFKIILTEGKNREIRRIFEHFDLKVNRLIRVKYGEYELGNLKPGEVREIIINAKQK